MDPNPRLLLFFAFLAFAAAVAGAADNESAETGISLGRRAGGLLHGLKKDALVDGDHGVALDEVGPGLFDALFASLSMILVSEVLLSTWLLGIRIWNWRRCTWLWGCSCALLSIAVSFRYMPSHGRWRWGKHATGYAFATSKQGGANMQRLMHLLHQSRIGDETFIIAALMAMRHPRSIVLSGALAALYVMTVLSTGLGRIVPNLISRKHTNSAATVLYLFFGLRLLYIAWKSDSKGSQKKEMEEVEEKLESGQGKSTIRRFFARFCTPIFLEAFILTFLAEWGDRSQIATIALATHKNAIGVAVGASVGHTLCTSLAVVGGSMLASKISQRTVATIGGVLFLGFSLSSYFYPPL